MADQMGTSTLSASLTTPARTYLWEVLIPVPVGGGDYTTFQIRAQSTEIPSVQTGEIPIPYKQTAGIVVAGKKQYTHTWTATFLESEDQLTYNALYNWTQQIVDDTAGIGVGDPLYKTDIYVNLIDVDGSNGMSFHLLGAWLQTINAVPLSYADNGVIRYQGTFKFDSFTINSNT